MSLAIPEEPTVSPAQFDRPGRERSTLGRFGLGLSLILIAFNLRLLFSSASSLLPELGSEFGLSAIGISMLTTLPVLCMGLFSPLAPRLAQRVGSEVTLLGLIVLLGLGTALRGIASVPLLYLGTALAGGSIAIGNVLLPSVVKRDFPDKVALMTGAYSMALSVGAAAAAGLTIPISIAFGGATGAALAAWAVPAFIAALFWLPQISRARKSGPSPRLRVSGLWKDAIAWQVTLLMGLQSALAYCVFGWMIPILRDRGLDGTSAGAVVSLSVAAQAISCLVAPHIAVRGRDQRLVSLVLTFAAIAALFGQLFGPIWTVWVWAALQGVGQGGLLAVALTVIVLRSPNAQVAAHLSGMAQFVGYILAAAGPLAMGAIRSWTGGFAWCAALFALLGLGLAITGWLAGRPLTVNATVTEPQASP
jgi:CP family cyanate transporter-like MFS transporter